VEPGCFANEHYGRIFGTFTRHCPRAPLCERTECAIADLGIELGEFRHRDSPFCVRDWTAWIIVQFAQVGKDQNAAAYWDSRAVFSMTRRAYLTI
jgi:hypothetical protein